MELLSPWSSSCGIASRLCRELAPLQSCKRPCPNPFYTPNSFYQVGQQSSNVLTPSQVRKYAHHFIYWRRAIAIPPLHARDMYIVNPNCDMRQLPQAAARWARQFPMLPALPNFLAELSVAPRPYKMHCPSKAYRPVYMAMLAWLMRGGWVTQLCTFAYVVVWPEIIYEVEYTLEAEDIARSKRFQGMSREPQGGIGDSSSITALGDVAASGSSSASFPLIDDGASDLATSTATLRDLSLSRSHSLAEISDDEHSPSSPSPLSGRPALSRNTTQGSSVTQSTPAEQAAEKARLERIADKAARELAQRATAHARKAVPEKTAHPSVNNSRHLIGISPHIILDAKKATGKDSLYLTAIGQRLKDRAAAHPALARGHPERGRDVNNNNNTNTTNSSSSVGASPRPGVAQSGGGGSGKDWDERVANMWQPFLKYFNGRSALERIALQEDMKRKDVWNLLTAMSEHLLCVRHW